MTKLLHYVGCLHSFDAADSRL